MLIDFKEIGNPRVLLRDYDGYTEGIILDGKYKGEFYMKKMNGEVKQIQGISQQLFDVYNKEYVNRFKRNNKQIQS